MNSISNLEIMVHYFWVLKLISIALLAYAVGKAVVIHKLKSKLWNVFSVILLVLSIVTPVKFSVNTKEMHKLQNVQIETTKVLPGKIEDKSFGNTISNLKGIQQSDIERSAIQTTEK